MAERKTVTSEESIREQKRLHPYMKPEVTPRVSMIVPGARVYGEDFVKVTIGHDADHIVVDSVPTEAPADRKPIIAVVGPDAEYAQYILEAQMEKARERLVAPQDLTPQERFDAVNAAWHDFVENKLRWLKGQSTFGAGGAAQRQRVVQNPDSRPKRSW